MLKKSFPFRQQVLALIESNYSGAKVNYSCSWMKCVGTLPLHRQFSLGSARANAFSKLDIIMDFQFQKMSPGCYCRCQGRYFSSASQMNQEEVMEPEEEDEENVRRISNEKVVVANRTHNIKVMSKILGVNPKEIRRVSSSYKIKEDRAKRTVERLEKFGFSKGSALLYPELLFMNPGAVENYIRIMREAEFAIIREEFITKFRGVIRRPLLTLRTDVGMPSITDVIESFCDELEVDKVFFKKFINNLPKNTERVTLFELRRQIIASYLSRLNLGEADLIYERFFTKYPRLNFRSLNWIKRNYRLLKDKIELSNEMILKHCYLLQADPDNVASILKLPSLAGMNVKALLQRRPRIAICAIDSILDIEKAFIEHEISLESVQKQLELYTLSSKTIRRRLEQLESTPQLRFLKVHPRIGRLLYYQNKAMERLEEFKTMDVVIPSIHLLSQDKARYKKSIAGGEIRTKGVDIVVVVSRLLNVSRQAVRQSLTRHQHWVHVPTLSVKETLSYLQSLHSFSTDALVDAIPLFLYPQEKVEQEVSNVLSSGTANLNDPYFLNMVMYFLERPTHFTGDGIWPDKMISHDDPEDDNDQHDDEEDDDGVDAEDDKNSETYKNVV